MPLTAVLTLILNVPVFVTARFEPLSVPSPVVPSVTIEYVAAPAFLSMLKYLDTSIAEPVKLTVLSVPVIVTAVADLFLIVTVPVIVPEL